MAEGIEEEEIQFNDNPILRLPSAPVYLSIMRTLDGKPIGLPVWNSFDHKEKRTMENENMSATLLSLSKNISAMASDKEKAGNIVHLNIDNKTYNIYLPYKEDDFQISFVVVFEEQDEVLIESNFKEELVRVIIKTLRNNSDFRQFLEKNPEGQITKSMKLYQKIQDVIARNVFKWDGKRVKYLKREQKKERMRLLEEAKKQAEEANKESEQSTDNKE